MTSARAHEIFRQEHQTFTHRFPWVADVRFYLRRKHIEPNPSARDLGWWDPENRTVNLLRSSLTRSEGQIRGILRHELGHAADRSDAPGHERRADALARAATGRPIRYTRRESLQHVTHGKPGRPDWLHQ
jgi:hypothetical protein